MNNDALETDKVIEDAIEWYNFTRNEPAFAMARIHIKHLVAKLEEYQRLLNEEYIRREEV